MRTKGAVMLLIVLLVCLPASQGLSQSLKSTQVPADVMRGFHERFPGVRRARWKLKSDHNFEAEFNANRGEIAAKFAATGKWLETESAIARSRLPPPVAGAVAQRFKGYKIIETQTVERWDDSKLIYELHLENKSDVVKLQLYADGTLLNQSAKHRSE